MWLMPAGLRTIEGPEAWLVRAAVALLMEFVDDEVDWEFGVPIFDGLQQGQKLAALAQVVSALMLADSPSPPRTAILDGTIAVIYGEIETLVAAEIEEERLTGDRIAIVRRRLRKACSDIRHVNIPPIDSAKLRDWVPLIEALLERVLLDRCWADASRYLDADPDTARAWRIQFKLDEDYLVECIPDPCASDLENIWDVLDTITGASDAIGEPGDSLS